MPEKQYKLEVHEGYIKDRKKISLDKKQLNKIRKDIEELTDGIKHGKQLINQLFPLEELKYRSWGIRIIYIVEKEKIILLSINRKKDDFTKAYKDALKRHKK